MKKSKTILIVEDEKSIRDAIVDILKINKFTVIEAKNGKEGLDIALLNHPDLILMDIVMPEMDGMTSLKNIREDSWGASVPVIILTNLSANSEQLIEDMVNQKPAHYLIKSDWKLHDVVKEINKILEI